MLGIDKMKQMFKVLQMKLKKITTIMIIDLSAVNTELNVCKFQRSDFFNKIVNVKFSSCMVVKGVP